MCLQTQFWRSETWDTFANFSPNMHYGGRVSLGWTWLARTGDSLLIHLAHASYMIELVDERLKEDYNKDQASMCINLALTCLQKIDPFRYRRVQMSERCMQMSEMINFFLTDFTLLCIYLTGIV